MLLGTCRCESTPGLPRSQICPVQFARICKKMNQKSEGRVHPTTQQEKEVLAQCDDGSTTSCRQVLDLDLPEFLQTLDAFRPSVPIPMGPLGMELLYIALESGVCLPAFLPHIWEPKPFFLRFLAYIDSFMKYVSTYLSQDQPPS